jgi:hypothetical protein
MTFHAGQWMTRPRITMSPMVTTHIAFVLSLFPPNAMSRNFDNRRPAFTKRVRNGKKTCAILEKMSLSTCHFLLRGLSL